MSPARSPDGRHGVIVLHAFGRFEEGDFLEDPRLIDELVADGHSWRLRDAVLLDQE
jgi:hypothetical protein